MADPAANPIGLHANTDPPSELTEGALRALDLVVSRVGKRQAKARALAFLARYFVDAVEEVTPVEVAPRDGELEAPGARALALEQELTELRRAVQGYRQAERAPEEAAGQAGRVDAATRQVAERYVTVSREDGVLVAHRGLRVDGEVLARGAGVRLEPEESELPGLAYTLEPTGDGALRVRSLHEEISVRQEVAGQHAVSGDLEVAGKLTVKGTVDPTDLQLDPQPRNPIPQASCGLWVSDGSTPGTVPGGLYFERGGVRVGLA